MSRLKDPGYHRYQQELKVAFEEKKKVQYDPYPHKRPGPQPDKSQKTNLKPDVKLSKFNKAKHSVQKLNKINWNDIRAMELSEGSSQGVIFVETEEGAFVVKGSTEVAIEYYLQKLQKMLKIPVPEMRLLKYNDPDFFKITTELERAAFSDELLHFRVKPRIDMAYLLIMEYIPGIGIEGMGRPRAQRVFTHYTPESRDRLIRLGFVLAFDTYINNYDRFPCGSIWDNDGNPSNVVLKAKVQYTTQPQQLNDQNDEELQFEKFYALDPRISCVNVRQDHTQQMLGKYYEKVETFFNDVFMELKGIMDAKIDPFREIANHKLSSIKRFIDLIFNYTSYYMTEIQILQVMIGIGIGMHNIVQLGIDRVGQLFIKQYIPKDKDWQGFFNKNLEQINIEVLADVLKIYTKLAGVYPDIIKWLHDITLGEYKVNILDWEKEMGLYDGGDEEREEEQIREQYLDEKKGSDSEEEKYDDEGNLTDEEYDKEDDLKRKINDIFYLDINQLAEDVKKGRDIDHYSKNPKELAQMKPDKYEN